MTTSQTSQNVNSAAGTPSKHAAISFVDGEELARRSAEVLAWRAERLGVSLEEAKSSLSQEPRYIAAARRQANQLGLTPGEVLDKWLADLRGFNFPSKNCLS